MNRARRRICAALALSALPAAGRAESGALAIGLFPNLPARKLHELYQPMAEYLAQQLGRPVRLYSAKDFRAFYQATRNNQFDVVVTAPNLAWLAMVESGYRPLTTFTNQVTGVVIVRRDSGIVSVANCLGKTVALVDPLSIVSQLGQAYFKSVGLAANVDYRVVTYNNHANAALAVVIDNADCAVIGHLPFRQMALEVQAKLHIIGETAAVPSQFFMANPKVTAILFNQIQTALIRFNHVRSGTAFIHAHHSGAIIAANSAALAAVQPYALVTRALLRQEAK